MIARIILFIWLLHTVLVNGLAQEVQLSLKVPTQITAGGKTRVDLNIQKGSLSGFARFQQALPAGVTASPLESAGADFSFADNKLNLIWLALPTGNEIRVIYEISIDRSLSGNFQLGGKFSWLRNNERSEAELPAQEVRILAASVTPAASPEQPAPTTAVTTAPTQESVPELAVYRQKPSLSPERNSYLVHLLVCKGDLERFVRLEEKILSGHQARAVESRGAIFSLEGGVAEFLWMQLPEEKYFTVSYELLPITGKPNTTPVIQGELSFVKEGDSKNIPVSERDFSISSNDQESLAALAASLKIEIPAATSVPKVYSPEEPAIQTQQRTTVSAPAPVPQSQPAITGIRFRVQLGAFQKPVNPSVQFARLGISEPVNEEYHQGLYKYTAGNYSSYQQAQNLREELARNAGLTGTFIVAYQDGKRIALQEALRLSGQK